MTRPKKANNIFMTKTKKNDRYLNERVNILVIFATNRDMVRTRAWVRVRNRARVRVRARARARARATVSSRYSPFCHKFTQRIGIVLSNSLLIQTANLNGNKNINVKFVN